MEGEEILEKPWESASLLNISNYVSFPAFCLVCYCFPCLFELLCVCHVSVIVSVLFVSHYCVPLLLYLVEQGD